VSACPAYEPLLLDRAAGALAPGDAGRLEAHLSGCAGCRAEGAAFADVLDLVRLPPPSAEE
jgi:anti-sigma factor RsiW